VLVDGRSVYSPTHGGVNWEVQDTLLEDVERIEVIRGPGATLWGSNAVNGVINIITKPANETQGSLVTAGVGDQGQLLGGVRHGGEIGRFGHYRAFTKYLHGQDLENGEGLSILSGEISTMAGVRADLTLSLKDSVILEGDALGSHSNSEAIGFSLQPPYRIVQRGIVRNQSGDLMASWTRRQSERSKTTLRASVDHFSAREPNFQWAYSNFNLEFQHQFTASESDEIVWGGAIRDSSSHGSQAFAVALTPASQNDLLYSGFVQDQHTFAGGRMSVVAGTKFEHNSLTGVEIQPKVTLLWTPASRQTLWAGVSRAVRTPSTTERNLRVNIVSPAEDGTLLEISLIGNPAYGAEDLLAYELGFRLQTPRRFSVDVAAFHNVYSHLQIYEPGPSFFEFNPPPPHLVIPSSFANGGHGQSNGVEIASKWNITEHWRLIPAYSSLWLDMRIDAGRVDVSQGGRRVEGASPRHQLQMRSELDLSRRLQLDAAIYCVSSLPALPVDAYARLDARLGYRLGPNAELSFASKNLQGGRHVEYLSVAPYSKATIGRSFNVKFTWSF